MTDDNRPHPDPDDHPTTVTRWPPFDQPGDNATTADETQTQWVPSDRPAAEAPADPPAEPPAADGWFAATSPIPTAPSEEPQWADWDQPWQPTDEPFDQAALPPTSDETRREPLANPEPRAPSEYVSPYPAPTPTPEPVLTPEPEPVPTPETEREPEYAGSVAARTSSLANLHVLRVLAQVACPILLFVGLTFSEDHAQRGWQAYTAWACFAMVCAVLQLAPLVGQSLGITTEHAWFLAAVGTAGLVGYWVIIVLPGVSSNTGFAQTLAAGFAVIGLWLTPGRRV